MSLLSFLPILMIMSGSYFLFKLRFFFIKHPIRTLKFAFSGKNKKRSVLSLALALAGTLGVGNISGVAIGIAVGGAGSVFWLIISAVFSSAIKYSEVYISYRCGGRGMIDVINGSFGNLGSFFASVYALFTLILSISMGSAFQGTAISESAKNTADISIYALAPIITLFCVIVTALGKSRIKGAVAVIIPLASIVYTGMCFAVIFSNLERIREVVLDILSAAFSFKSASGGILGFAASSGIKEGFARGLLSNEAGAGTSSLSHTSHIEGKAELSEKECMRSGIFGIFEVIFDTLLICPLTAFAILLGTDTSYFGGSLFELSAIFQKSIPHGAPTLLLICIIFFAVSTTLCWYYYGKVALTYLFPKSQGYLFSFLFFLCFFLSLVWKLPYVLFITDTALFILSIISLSALIKKRALILYDGKALERKSINL